jgi:hypothetical protein
MKQMSYPGDNTAELSDLLKSCKKCSLHKTRILPVLPEGNIRSKIFMIAQSPGKTENQTGNMFTGPSGKIFELVLPSGSTGDIRVSCRLHLLHLFKRSVNSAVLSPGNDICFIFVLGNLM